MKFQILYSKFHIPALFLILLLVFLIPYSKPHIPNSKFQIPNTAYASVQEASTASSLCGNGVIDSGEECDGSNLAGQTYMSRGFSGGSLSCNPNCTINTSLCTSGGGGGGGGGYTAPVTGVTLSGRAYPGMKVTVLKDAQIAASTIADPAANFRITVSGLSAGSYIFGVYSEDSQGIKSSLLTFPAAVTSGVTIEISNIFIAPTIAVDKSEVKRGDNVAIFGQSVPSSEITIAVNSEEEFFDKTLADASGAYLYNFDTAQLGMGQHFTKSKSALDGAISFFSKTVSFNIGTKTIFAQPEKTPAKGDMNNDKRVNLVDFSVVAYWYKRPSPPATVDLNNDGKVDLVDFSILAYYWTG